MKSIKVLGPGCNRCAMTVSMIEGTADKLGVEVKVEKVSDMAEIARHGIMSTPGVVIDGKLVHAGGLPKTDDITRWLSELRRRVMLEYNVTAHRIDAHGSRAQCKEAEIILDTDVKGRPDAFNPAELLLAAIAACMIKGMERIAPMIHFEYRGLEVRLHGVRQDAPPFMSAITYELIVDTDADDRRLALMHDNVRKFGTVSNTVAAATKLEGVMRRAERPTV